MYLPSYVSIYLTNYLYIPYMMQGCHTPPPPPPPHPMVSPVAWQVGVVLFGLVAFPVWSCLASSPPPCGLAPVVFLVGPAPPVGGSMFYSGMVWLLPLVSTNVIVTCLVPSPPCGLGPVVVLVGPAPPVWGSVFYRDMVWLPPLVSSNVIVTCSLPYKISCGSFLLANGAVPALMRFSAPVKKHCRDHSPSSSLPLVCLGSFRLCGTAESWEQRRLRGPGGRGPGSGGIPWRGGGGGVGVGGWGPGTREHIYTYAYIRRAHSTEVVVCPAVGAAGAEHVERASGKKHIL